jgi:tetratricopeptide (TPR) repeat protein
MSAENAREKVEGIISKVGEAMERPLRAGISYAPCPGFESWEIMDCASKALVHAGFLEPFSVVVFDAVSLNISGDTLFSQGRISEAVVEYEKALILDPSEKNVLNSLGVCYGHLGQAQKALDCFKKALSAAPEDFMAYYNLGYALMSQGKLEQARVNLEKSLDINPGHGDTLFQLGCLAQTQGRLQEALDYFKSAAKSPGCRQAVHRRLGEALAAAGHLQEAEEAFNRAVKANGNDAQALSSLAGLYLDRHANLEIALSLAKRAASLEPESARHQRVCARALVSLDRLDEASELLEKGVAQYGKDPYMAVQRGDLEALRGNKKVARKEYERALSLEPQLEAAKSGLKNLGEE